MTEGGQQFVVKKAAKKEGINKEETLAKLQTLQSQKKGEAEGDDAEIAKQLADLMAKEEEEAKDEGWRCV